jgi:hypothetical protein
MNGWARVIDAIRYWSLPLVLVLAWIAAATYTLVILSAATPAAAGRTSLAPAPAVVAAVHAPGPQPRSSGG